MWIANIHGKPIQYCTGRAALQALCEALVLLAEAGAEMAPFWAGFRVAV